ncbi:MAG: helix-turn-helix transcriptional regulator [Kosmotogaceae bacterium]
MKIKEIREEMGITQEELANVAGISRTTLSKIERGKMKVTDFFLADAMAAYLDLPVEEAFPAFRKDRKSPLVVEGDYK